MDRSERLYRIDRLLRASPVTPFVKLQEALGVSRAQLKRDADDRELLMEVLKLGPQAEVLAPPELRQRAARQLREAAKRYG